MILDLTGRTPLSLKNARLLSELASELRPLIVELIDKISMEKSENIDWWVTPLASRNPYISRFSLNCCRITLLDKLLTNHKVPTEVWVDSHAMADLAACLGSKHGVKLRIRTARLKNLRAIIWRVVKSLLATLFHTVMQFACVRILLSRVVTSGGSSLIFVDTFLYADSIRDGVFYDRHFPSIADSLSARERERLRYFPTFYKIRNYPKVFHQLCGLRNDFIFKEDYLCLSDYLYAFGHGFRIGRIRLDSPLMLNKLSLNALMREEFRNGWMWPSAIEALLKYRAIGRMKKAGVNIGRVLDWFENQDIDRGANAGYRRYYSNIEVVGYIGYVASQHYLCMYPTPAEKKAKVLPTKFAVMGKGYVDTIKEFCPNLVVQVAPALRYSGQLPVLSSSVVKSELSIVVALPVVHGEALEILNDIRHLLLGLKETPLSTITLQIQIKPHPASKISRNYTFGIVDGSKVCVKWVDGKLNSLLSEADVLVSSASSACFEALTLGVPVIVHGSCYGFTYVQIPQAIPQGKWQICYTWEEMLVAIIGFLEERNDGLSVDVLEIQQLREDYLEPVHRENVRSLVLGNEICKERVLLG